MTDDEPRPLTRTELIEWLDNIVKMYKFSLCTEYGSNSHKLYVEGMPKAAEFIKQCVLMTPEIK